MNDALFSRVRQNSKDSARCRHHIQTIPFDQTQLPEPQVCNYAREGEREKEDRERRRDRTL
jgi:hypothetical protein